MSQLAFAVDAGLCNYGTPKMGEDRPCDRPATHRARWEVPAASLDGTPNPRAGSGGIDCCLDHANYYAEAWAFGPLRIYTWLSDRAWIDVLGKSRRRAYDGAWCPAGCGSHVTLCVCADDPAGHLICFGCGQDVGDGAESAPCDCPAALAAA